MVLAEESAVGMKKGADISETGEKSRAPIPQADGIFGKEDLLLQNCAQSHGFVFCPREFFHYFLFFLLGRLYNQSELGIGRKCGWIGG